MLDFVKQFRDIKNRCFHLAILESDLTDLALNGLCSSIKEKLEHYEFLTINKLLQKAFALKTRLKDSCDNRSCCPNMHATEYHLDSSDGETNDCCFAEFIWPTKKSVTCPSVKLVHKN
jgi:hypothetical protein